jgi:ABC-type phosphate transport system permease subunit
MHSPITTVRRHRRSWWQLVDLFERPAELLIKLCGWSSILGVLAIFVFIFKEAAPMIPRLDWEEFFTSTEWVPHPAQGNEAKFGALALIVGTFSTSPSLRAGE